MLKRFAFAAAAALLALGPARAEQDDPVNLSLTFKPPSFKVRRPLLVLNGAAGLPDGVFLKVNLSRVTEQAAGQTLLPIAMGAGDGTTTVEAKKFLYDQAIEGPGKYSVRVRIPEEIQQKDVAAEMKKRVGAKRDWFFEFLIWGDDLIPAASNGLPDVMALVQESREMVEKFEKASASKAQWEVDMKPLAAAGEKFKSKLEHHALKAYYPAAVNNLFYTIRNVVNNAPYYTYGADGKFTGARDYHADGEKVKTFQNEDFNWGNLKKYIEDTPSMAGREFCLWVVKDLRRMGGAMRPDIQDALKRHKAAAGVDFFQERLLKATISDIDALEAAIRGAKPPPAAPDGGGQKQ